MECKSYQTLHIDRGINIPPDEPSRPHMLHDQQCFDAELDTVMEHRLVEKVKAIMERTQPGWDDEAIEAMALAQYHDTTYVPPHGYIQELVNVQNPNGSWSWNQGQEVMGSQHTTVLALWALLQYKPLKGQHARPMVSESEADTAKGCNLVSATAVEVRNGRGDGRNYL